MKPLECRRPLVGILLLVTCLASPTHAQTSPFQLALFHPVQIIPADQSISGISLNILYGKNRSVSGLDIGLINHTTGEISLGIEYGLVGYCEGEFKGWQFNLASFTRGDLTGVQMGAYDGARHVHGLQFGLLNHAESMKGIQIGLVNIIDEGGFLPVCIIANWSL